MPQITNNTSSRTNGLIAGIFMFAMLFAVVSVVQTTTAPTSVQAQGSCGKDVCQNESGSFTVNTVDNSQITLNFSAAENEVFEDESIELQWDSENADDLQSSGAWRSFPRTFSGSASLSRAASSSDYEFLLTASDSSGNSVTETETVTVKPRPTILDSFNYQNVGGREDIHAGSPGDVDLYLSWSASNAAGNGYLQAGGDTADGQWQGDYALDNPNYGLKLSPGDYTFCLRPYDSLDQQNQAISDADACLENGSTITVLPPPPRYSFSLTPSSVSIDGEPAAQTTLDIALSSENSFSGTLDLSVDESSLPPELIGSDGVNKVDFSFTDDSFSEPSQTETLTITVSGEPIYEDVSGEITININRTPSVDSRAQGPSSITFQLNAEGYNPRTIEEF